MRRLFLVIVLLLGAAGAALAQQFGVGQTPLNASNCNQTGPYPWNTSSCLNAADLNNQAEMSVGGRPPGNATGQGAGYGKWWLDNRVNPARMRMCIVAPPGKCSTTYNAAQWYEGGAIDAGQIDWPIGGGAATVASSGVVDLALYRHGG